MYVPRNIYLALQCQARPTLLDDTKMSDDSQNVTWFSKCHMILKMTDT